MRSWLGALALLLATHAIAGEPVLVRLNNQADLHPVRVLTFAGERTAEFTPVTPSPQIMVALFLDTLAADQYEPVQQSLLSLHSAIREKKDLALLRVRSDGTEFLGPYPIRSALQSALKTIFAPESEEEDSDPVEAPDAYAQLASLLPAQGEWASMLIIGDFPIPDPVIRKYLASYLSNHFRSARLRVSYWAPGDLGHSLFDAMAAETGGIVAPNTPADLIAEKGDADRIYAELRWEDPVLKSGFHLYQARVQDSLLGEEPVQFSSISKAPGFRLPEIAHYKILRDRAAALSATLKQKGVTAERLDRIRVALNEALAINPSDEETLAAAADLFEQAWAIEEAAAYLRDLSDLQPTKRDLFARLGDLFFRAHNFSDSESALMKARALQAPQHFVSKELGQISAARGEHAKAISFFDESLKSDADDAETWFLRASSAGQLQDSIRQMESLERGLSLKPDQLSRRTDLVRLYLDRKEFEKALNYIQPVLQDPPPDSLACAAYAEFLEQAGQPDKALVLWKRTLLIDPELEQAHWSIAHILFDRSDFHGCIKAASEGLARARASSRLYLIKSEAQERSNLWYESRRTLQEGSEVVAETDYLQRYAENEDKYGRIAGKAYRKGVIECEKKEPDSPKCSALIARGFKVSIRDGDREAAEWFAQKLRSIGRSEEASLLADKINPKFEVRIPGGMAAVLRILGEKEKSTPEDFLKDYSRKIVQLGYTKNAKGIIGETIARHFEIITDLEALGQRNKDKIIVVLSINDSGEKKRAQKVLRLLGWEMEGQYEFKPASGASAAKRQQTSAALQIDEIAMQEALKAGRAFTLEISNDWVYAPLGEAAWRNQFYGKRNYPGGFAQALAEDFDLARLFAGISELDAETSAQLVNDFGLKSLYEKYAEPLFGNSINLVVKDGRAVVPGGQEKEAVWERAIGAHPSNPSKFFRELLRKDDGKMLAFFSCLMQLDRAHQSFFSASELRLKRFYELFRESPEISAGNRRSTPFQDFITQVPLDSDLHIEFPGSPEVWMVAKGQSDSERHVARMLKKVERIASQDVEDKILLRLARTDFTVGLEEVSELAHFMAVVRVDAHRLEPMDEAAALLLAQQYSYHRAIWPYLMDLRALDVHQYTQLFRLSQKLRDLNELVLNDVLGEMNAVAKLLCLLRDFDRIDEKQAALIFGSYCERLNQAASNSDFARAALDSVIEMTKAAGISESDPDSAIRDLLITPGKTAALVVRGRLLAPAARQRRREEYQRTLEIQKVPSLKSLFAIWAAAGNLVSGEGKALDHVKQINSNLETIGEVKYAKSANLDKKAKENFVVLTLDKARELARELREAASKKKPNRKKIASRSMEFLGELNSQVRLALTGVLYAFYFHPTDLLLSEDPSFLRRHQFFPLDGTRNFSIYYPAELKSDHTSGSFLIGGFADMSRMAGEVATATAMQFQEDARPFAASVLGALRDTNWQSLTDKDLRITGLRIRTAREWILRAATEPDAMSGLADSFEGILSASRRAHCLHAIRRLQWDSAWDMLSVSDLFFLGEEYLRRFKEEPEYSPTVAELRKLSAGYDSKRLYALGPELSAIYECSHSHILRLPPFENFENLIFPDKMAERSNEFKLYLAELFDRSGIPAAFLESAAEKTAVKLFADLRLNSPRDWKTILRAYSNMKEPWEEIEVAP